MPRMNKRILAAILWFYTGWYAGAVLADFIGVSGALGPIVGVAAAALIVVDPRQVIWARANRVGSMEAATEAA